MQDKIIITCALTGAGPLSANPNQPVTPMQIADSGLAAADAGAAILHIHVRDPKTGSFSGELDLYEEVVERIRAKNKDVILNLTTGLGAGFMPADPMKPDSAGPESHIWAAEKRVEHVVKLKPEICTLDLVTAQVFGGVVISLEPVLTRMADLIRAAGVTPEIELFDSGDAVLAKHLIAKGVLDGPGIYSFVMGLNFTMPATPETMIYIKSLLPDGAIWQGFGIGRNQFPMALQSCLLGGQVRVGMEDNVFISKGAFATSNAELVTKARHMVEAIGPSIATPAEARALLGLAGR
ncbi:MULTISPECIES: 3-keto-5-aminohexanoate cleavage protein [Burkholderia]|uniref:3-keto-5-aminohexanoate cleavage protein n=1 Tax=Burkholderia TaxID=32008 RepID=UPI00078BFA63|nr:MULTISPECIES: 3-keto-5-aminohexanoate cleavage protein [Burkholderia]AMU04673.1 NADPH:quinone reductase [Burkholderia cenocepacia]RQS24172.1 3-keto-5-aminohexanoate cleavage protein [Burkholderia sp. Bp8995]RQS38901.1 3-keto-5-aminohexanoate cleavage protein [Burkholderia sp. Bp8989]